MIFLEFISHFSDILHDTGMTDLRKIDSFYKIWQSVKLMPLIFAWNHIFELFFQSYSLLLHKLLIHLKKKLITCFQKKMSTKFFNWM